MLPRFSSLSPFGGLLGKGDPAGVHGQIPTTSVVSVCPCPAFQEKILEPVEVQHPSPTLPVRPGDAAPGEFLAVLEGGRQDPAGDPSLGESCHHFLNGIYVVCVCHSSALGGGDLL